MNILLIHGSHKEGGGDTIYINQLIQLLPQYDIKPFLVTIEKEKKGYSVSTSNHTADKNFHTSKNLSTINDFIKEFCDNNSIDLIHLHTIYQPRITRHCLKLRPVIKTPHATDMVCPGTYKFFTKSRQICTIPFGKHCLMHAYTEKCCSRSPRKLLKNYYNVRAEVNEFADKYKAVIVMSDFVKSECIKTGMNPAKIFVIPYFTPVVSLPEINNNKRLLYVGRLTIVKGVHTMIEALAPLLISDSEVYLDIIGDGPYRSQLESLATRYKLNHKIKFHKWQSKTYINDALSACTLLIFPSIYPEAFGISGIEAMMHGKPVVGFDVGGVSTWLKDGITGFLVKPGDIEMMRERTSQLLSDTTLYKRMSTEARKHALDNYVPNVHLERLTALYSTYRNSEII